jgi:hypothetical protein
MPAIIAGPNPMPPNGKPPEIRVLVAKNNAKRSTATPRKFTRIAVFARRLARMPE